MRSAEIYLVRHGVTDFNQIGRFQGISNTHLNEDGRLQAELLRDRFLESQIHLDRIYTSTLMRTQQTAKPIADALNLDVEVFPGIEEIHGGLMEGRTHLENAENFRSTMETIMLKPYYTQMPEGESGKQVYQRMVQAFLEIGRASIGSRVLVVSHGFALQMLQSYLQNIPADETKRLICANTAVSKVYFHEDETIRVSYLNDASHLPARWQVSAEQKQTEIYQHKLEESPIYLDS